MKRTVLIAALLLGCAPRKIVVNGHQVKKGEATRCLSVSGRGDKGPVEVWKICFYPLDRGWKETGSYDAGLQVLNDINNRAELWETKGRPAVAAQERAERKRERAARRKHAQEKNAKP